MDLISSKIRSEDLGFATSLGLYPGGGPKFWAPVHLEPGHREEGGAAAKFGQGLGQAASGDWHGGGA